MINTSNGYVNIDVKDMAINDTIVVPGIYRFLMNTRKPVLLVNITNVETNLDPVVTTYGIGTSGYMAYEGYPIYLRCTICRIQGAVANYSYKIDQNDAITRI